MDVTLAVPGVPADGGVGESGDVSGAREDGGKGGAAADEDDRTPPADRRAAGSIPTFRHAEIVWCGNVKVLYSMARYVLWRMIWHVSRTVIDDMGCLYCRYD